MPTTPPPVLQVSVETPFAQTTSVGLPEVRHVDLPVSPCEPSGTPPATSHTANWLGSALALWQRRPQGEAILSDNTGMNPAASGH